MVHGAFADAWCFDRLRPAFAERGWTCDAIDLPRHGAAKADADGSPPASIAEYLHALVDRLRVRDAADSPRPLDGRGARAASGGAGARAGAEDRVVSPASVRATAAGLRSATVWDVPGHGHMLLVEPGAEALAARIAAWCDAPA